MPRRRWARAGRVRRVPGQMNKLESNYAIVLEARKRTGEILDWGYEEWTFKLAHDTRYTPDFWVLNAEGEIELHETKGGLFRDDAKVKLKVAASKFPFRFVLVRQASKRDGGAWSFEEVAA